ncbi:MAG TPA: TetR/AcrR family transcriptional regulator [Caulobacteraceae bacterium]|nr:TetR/AcrR family transcriptional regulator [Caulobacteraceae bacterium]
MVEPPPSRKRQRTRAALIEATLAIVAERGFAAVSLSEVAARAGVTTGSIYSNFRGKGELLWEAAASKRRYVVPEVAPGASLKVRARAIARAMMQQMPQIEGQIDFHREMLIYSRTDPELQAIQAAHWRALFDAIAAGVEAELGDRLTMAPQALSIGFQALIRGFSAQWGETPGAITEDVVASNFEALLIGATTPAGGATGVATGAAPRAASNEESS